MKTPVLPLLLALVATLPWLPAAAEKADRDKPMNVEADALRYDDRKKSSSFTGNVVVTKGTIVMRGDRLDVRQDEAGQQLGTLTGGSKGRAFFRQKRDGVDEYIEGEGDSIEYDGRSEKVRFSGRAELRRLRGSTLSDSVSGAVIVYDQTSDQFTVDGGKAQTGQASETPATGGRVRVILSPRAAASAPAQPATPAPGLRQSTELGGARK